MCIGRINNPDPKQRELWRQVERIEKSWKEPQILTRDVCAFIAEVRKENGKEYPPGTIYDLVLMLSLYLEREHGIDHLTSPAWPKIRNTLNGIMAEQSTKGLGQSNERDFVTEEQEDYLWKNNFLGDSNPDQLHLTIFFLLGKNFSLRGGSEHRDLVRYPTSQIKVTSAGNDKIYLRYQEFKSKTNQGGLSAQNVKKPCVAYCFPNELNKARCPVLLFIKYVRYCPLGSDDSTAFYLRSNVNWQTSKLWYTRQPIGKQMLNDYLKNLMADAGFMGNFTNHSLRATTATRLFQGYCPEQLIAEQTGHTSNAIRCYKKSNLLQKEGVSKILAHTNFSKEKVEKNDMDKQQEVASKSPKQSVQKSVNNTVETQVSSSKECVASQQVTTAVGTESHVSLPQNIQGNLAGLVNIHFHFNGNNYFQALSKLLERRLCYVYKLLPK